MAALPKPFAAVSWCSAAVNSTGVSVPSAARAVSVKDLIFVTATLASASRLSLKITAAEVPSAAGTR